MKSNVNAWLADRDVKNIEIIVADLAGTARGKIQPVAKLGSKDLKLPIAVFGQTINGTYHMRRSNVEDKDMDLRPDVTTLRMVPWAAEPTASVIADCYDVDGQPVDVSPRTVLKNVVSKFEKKGWNPIVAPEVEFYLTAAPENAADDPVTEETRETDLNELTDPYGVDRLHDLGDFFQQLTEDCRLQNVPLGAISQELGPAQFEVNFQHGPAVELADAVFHFKRTVKRAAIAHGMRATFLAKLDPERPGSSLHLHQSVYDGDNDNVFSDSDGSPSELFESYLGGLQKHMTDALLLFAPYANSYRRFLSYWSSPVNLEWGVDNRTVGLRVPMSSADARRVENRLAGSDVNPYLVIAGTLACGYLGMTQKLTPRPPVEGSAYKAPFALHRHLYGALDSLRESSALRDVLGDDFVTLYTAVKDREYREFQERITDWEREELMFSV